MNTSKEATNKKGLQKAWRATGEDYLIKNDKKLDHKEQNTYLKKGMAQ